METKVDLEAIYSISEDVVSREIEGEILIVPLVSGIGDMEDELFNLNESGKAIWQRLDGQKNLKEVVEELSQEFEAPKEEIEQDVKGFMEELLKRGMVVDVSKV
jgi:coenzyme PQQ biosynthesis protein PqqD